MVEKGKSKRRKNKGEMTRGERRDETKGERVIIVLTHILC